MVRRVQVHAVPAAGEEDLSTESIRAIVGREAVRLGLCSGVVVETVVADSLGSESTSVVAEEWVTSNHSEASREGLQRVVVGAPTLQVVDSSTTKRASTITSLGNSLE